MIDVATRILADAGRALSARKILQAGERDALFDAPVSLADLRGALESAAEAGQGVRQVRRGVFALDDAAPAEAKAPIEAPADDEAPTEKRRRRRRQKPRDLAGETPATALTVEDAVAEAEATDDAATLRANIWKKMRKRAADVAGVELSPPKAAPAPKAGGIRALIAQKLKARLKAEADAWVEPPKPEPLPLLTAAERLVSDDAVADLKARLAARWKANPLKAIARPKPTRRKRRKTAPVVEQAAPVVEAVEQAAPVEQAVEQAAPVEQRRPRRQRRRPAESRAAESRAVEPVATEPSAPEPSAPEASEASAEKRAPRRQRRPARTQQPVAGGSLADRIGHCIAEADAPLDHHRLAEQLGAAEASVRAAILGANNRANAAGHRAPFAIDLDGRVGLSQWSLSRRYRMLEERIDAALREQRDIIREDLLMRVGELSAEGFERVVRMCADGMGFEDLQVIERDADAVTLLGQRDGEATAVIAHRTPDALDTDAVDLSERLAELDAVFGVIITTSSFTDAAREASRRGAARLIDGRSFARLLYTQGVGLISHRPVIRYIDHAFFTSLG